MEFETSIHILTETFGPIVSDIAKGLYNISGVSVKSLTNSLKDKFSTTQIQKGIITLLNHGLLNNIGNASSNPLYSLNLESIIYFLYKPLILETIQNVHGIHSMAMIKLLFDNGSHSLQTLIQDTIASFPHHISLSTHIIEAFKNLTELNFIDIINNSNSDEVSVKIDKTQFLEKFTEYFHKCLNPLETRKRTFKETENESLDNFIVNCNMKNLCSLVIEENIIIFFRTIFDELAANIVKTIIDIQRRKYKSGDIFQQFAVSLEDIASNIPDLPYADSQTISLYLSSLTSHNSGFYITLVTDRLYDGYVLDIKNILKRLCEENIVSLIFERYGMSAKRIYNLLLSKSYLEQKQISDLSMTPFKETKEILYSMYEDGFIDVQTIPRTPDANPLTSIFLFRIDFNRCILEAIQYCKNFMSNIIIKRLEIYENIKKLIEKNIKTKQLFNNIDLMQITISDVTLKEDQINEYLNHNEKLELKHLQNHIIKLDNAEVNISKSLLFIDTFHTVNISNPVEKKNV